MKRMDRMLAGCLVGVSAALLLAAGCAGDPAGPRPPTVTYSLHHETPSWSAQGLIAYRDNGIDDPSMAGIWILDPEARDAARVIPYGLCPDWSPDGARLAFSEAGQIRTISAGGSDELQLTFEGGNFFPDWSPDGSEIAWTQTVGSSPGIWAASWTGTDQRWLVRYGADPDWHPTERVVLHDGWQDTVHAISEYSLDSGVSTPVRTDDPGAEAYSVSPVYSPDGLQIAFTSLESGELSQIWLMNADGSGARQLTWHGGTSASWSPDGVCIVYTRENSRSNAPEDGVLWVVNTETGNSHQLTFKR